MKKTKTNDPDGVVRREIFTPAASLKLRDGSGDAPSRVIEGYAIRFNEPSEVLGVSKDGTPWRETIAPEAVTRELLDSSDILMTLFHDPEQILARSRKGAGTLSYEVDREGVRFSFEAPRTAEGDKAVELVSRGELDGCSFAFSTRYGDPSCVSREKTDGPDGKKAGMCTVRKITGIYDFTITPCPAYPSTSVGNRDLSAIIDDIAPEEPEEEQPGAEHAPLRVRCMAARHRLTRK